MDRLLRYPGIDTVLLALVPTAIAVATGDDLVRAVTEGPGRRERPVAVVRLEQDLPVKLLPAGRAAPSPRTPNRSRRHGPWCTPPVVRPG